MHFYVCQIYSSLLFWPNFFNHLLTLQVLHVHLHFDVITSLTFPICTFLNVLSDYSGHSASWDEVTLQLHLRGHTSASSKKAALGPAAIQPQQCAQTRVLSTTHPKQPSKQPLGCPAAGLADIPLYSLYHTSCRQQCFCNTTTPSAFHSIVVLGLISAFWIYCNVSWISAHTLSLSQCFPLLWAAHTSS